MQLPPPLPRDFTFPKTGKQVVPLRKPCQVTRTRIRIGSMRRLYLILGILLLLISIIGWYLNQ